MVATGGSWRHKAGMQLKFTPSLRGGKKKERDRERHEETQRKVATPVGPLRVTMQRVGATYAVAARSGYQGHKER